MANVASPYGFQPVQMIANRPVGGALPTTTYRIKQNYAGVIPYGSPVVLSTATTYTSGNAVTVTYSGQTVTLTFTTAVAGLYAGMPVTVSGVTGATAVNGTWTLLTGSAGTVFTYTVTNGTITGTVGGTAAVVGGAGFIQLPTNGTFNSLADNYIGIFVGAYYLNPFNNNQPQWDQWYPGSVNAAGMYARVVDDPQAVFKVQAASYNFDALANVGNSYGFTVPATPYNVGSKDSTISLTTGTATSTTSPFKIVQISQDPNDTNATGYVDCYVMANIGAHVLNRAQ